MAKCILCNFRSSEPLCAIHKMRLWVMQIPWPVMDKRWLERARCAGTANYSAFFPEHGNHRAPKVCDSCPVRYECAMDAVALGENRGYRAGRKATEIVEFFVKVPA